MPLSFFQKLMLSLLQTAFSAVHIKSPDVHNSFQTVFPLLWKNSICPHRLTLTPRTGCWNDCAADLVQHTTAATWVHTQQFNSFRNFPFCSLCFSSVPSNPTHTEQRKLWDWSLKILLFILPDRIRITVKANLPIKTPNNHFYLKASLCHSQIN